MGKSPTAGPTATHSNEVLTPHRSISIACWVFVFSPQILENFRRHSADGLSLIFIIVWLLGDIFNILGAVLQGVLPTMTILAIYYTLADIVLLGQCFYYRGFTLSDVLAAKPFSTIDEEAVEGGPTEESTLLPHKRPSNTPPRPRIADADLSPATPYIPPKAPSTTTIPTSTDPSLKRPRSPLYTLLFNTSALILVCAAGVLGWWLSSRSPRGQYPHRPHSRAHHHYPSTPSTNGTATAHPLPLDPWGQLFGYLCALLYLGSRIPQLLLNHRRKSTSGVSMLFFLFACVGNLTYVLSILAYEPRCAQVWDGNGGGCEGGEWGRGYGRHVLVNASWLVGSAGTLVLDMMIFGQFWVYREG